MRNLFSGYIVSVIVSILVIIIFFLFFQNKRQIKEIYKRLFKYIKRSGKTGVVRVGEKYDTTEGRCKPFWPTKKGDKKGLKAQDSGSTNSGSTNSGATDTGATDTGATDTGITDSGTTDSGTTDSGTTDSGTTDSGTTDSNPIDCEAFITHDDGWIIMGASVIGRSHVDLKTPCQDSLGYCKLGNGWGIAVTSDGAGSAKDSEIGSKIVVSRAIEYFKRLVIEESWQKSESLPPDYDWMKCSYKALKSIRDDLALFAEKEGKIISDFNSTIIVFIHTPNGALVCHVGDGRAGYKDETGNWHSAITPHKGETANQTIFITTDFWQFHFFETKKVPVPESRVIREKISAFTLMSDGCEKSTWLCNQFDSITKLYYDPNMPYPDFFNPLIKQQKNMLDDEHISLDDMKNGWIRLLVEGNDKIKYEMDDKTLILGSKV